MHSTDQICTRPRFGKSEVILFVGARVMRVWKRHNALVFLGFVLPSLALAGCGDTPVDVDAAIAAGVEATVQAQVTPTPVRLRVFFRIESVSFEDRIGDVLPQGVFIKAWYDLVNVSDSTMYASESDITLVTEDGQRHEQSMEGLLAYVGGDQSRLFDRERVARGSILPSIAIFDVPLTGFRRRLQIQFRDGPTQPLPSPSSGSP